ncbi:MAG: hypothetical protein KAS21_05960 [Candidatus Aminicenantes bacterium]|nr:hypothetical protein [Candidatus Aminicenantes bacterium]MCK5004611.1 hypothetical protein [Candidatus Aminicenantes bacterium]
MKKIFLISILVLFFGASFISGQSLNFKIGIFSPMLESDLWEVNKENLYFSNEDLQSIYYGVEYEHFIGRHFSMAFEAGTFEKTVYSQYKDYEYDDGSPIYQDLFLSISGIEANIKIYPIGHRKVFNPYIGAGVGVYFWEYEQWGDFIDFNTWEVYEGYGYTEKYSAGFNFKGGFVFRFKRHMGISFEAKYQYLKGQLSNLFEGFEKLDLSGLTLNIGLNLFFR